MEREIDKVVAINNLIFPVTDNFSLYCANRHWSAARSAVLVKLIIDLILLFCNFDWRSQKMHLFVNAQRFRLVYKVNRKVNFHEL